MYYILGLDSSKRNTGVSIIKYDSLLDMYELVEKHMIRTKYKLGDHLFQSELESYNQLISIINDFKNPFKFCTLEGFAFGGQGLTKLASTAAVFQLACVQKNISVNHIAPKRVKLLISGSGNSDKNQVRTGLKKFLNNFDSISWKTFDESDSAAIAIAANIVFLNPDDFQKVVKIKKKKI